MTVCYTSHLAHRLADFVAFRRSIGFEYRTQVHILRQFDAVVQDVMPRPGPITLAVLEAWVRSRGGLRPLTRRVQLSTIRQFLIYLQRFEPETYVPGRAHLPAGGAPRAPHIYSEDEIHALLRHALDYPTRYTCRRWLLHYTLIGFLYVTALRVTEALNLTLLDLDLRQGLVYVRKTKFHKSRIVPLKPSSLRALQRYLRQRAERGYPTTPSAPVFVGHRGGALRYSTVAGAFRRIAMKAGLRARTGEIGLRLHDLRHTAAVRRFFLWHKEGKDVQALLPVLVTYLGHSAVRCTEIYLTATPQLLAEASKRFEEHYPLRGDVNDEAQT